jgi:hypothetical protein
MKIFPVFSIKLGLFIAHTIFPYATNTQALQKKSEKQRNQIFIGLTPKG